MHNLYSKSELPVCQFQQFVLYIISLNTTQMGSSKLTSCGLLLHLLLPIYYGKKDYQIGTLRYNWPMSAHASQAVSTSTVPIQKIYLLGFLEPFILELLVSIGQMYIVHTDTEFNP